MVEIDVASEGQLHCTSTHAPSGASLATDAPLDNQGRGQAFSPTDLLATSLGTCMLTTMGIHAQKIGLDLAGSAALVVKEMTGPPRRVGRLVARIDLPAGVPEKERPVLRKIAETCPVALSIHPELKVELEIRYGAAEAAGT